MIRPGRVVVVDLSNRTWWVEELDNKTLYLYLGGRGLGARLLAKFLRAETDPLSADNPLMVVAGPLQGTDAPFSSKAVLSTKSPLTNGYLFSVASGRIAHHLAACGYSALVLLGASERPVHLLIRTGSVEFRDAECVWGKPVTETYSMLQQDVGVKDFGTAMIGPAGENLVRYASVITELPRKRAFGRGGAGAVMGAKRLKAFSIIGTGRTSIADQGLYRAARQAQIRAVVSKRSSKQQRMAFGTTTSMDLLQEFGMLPTRNWQRGAFDYFEKIAPMAFGSQWAGETHPCAHFCPAPCARAYRVKTGDYAGSVSEGPDYETIYALGTNLAIDRFDAVVAMDSFCDEMGMDTISAGVTLGFVMECFERGMLDKSKTGGLVLQFGDYKAAMEALEQTAKREGFGSLLAEGAKRCADYVGHDSESFAMHARGLELGGWGCRAAYGQALQYALSPRGGCHHDLGLPAKTEWGTTDAVSVEGKGRLVLGTAARRIVRDSAIQCSFAGLYFDVALLIDLLKSITGHPWSEEDLIHAGERILNLERLLNVREGVDRSQDRLPKRLLTEPLLDGPMKGSMVPLEELKDAFYEAAGWHRGTGRPTLETLQRLNLELQVVEAFRGYLDSD